MSNSLQNSTTPTIPNSRTIHYNVSLYCSAHSASKMFNYFLRKTPPHLILTIAPWGGGKRTTPRPLYTRLSKRNNLDNNHLVFQSVFYTTNYNVKF